MKVAMLIGMFFLLAYGLFGLAGYSDSASGTLDTVHPTLVLTAPNGGEVWYIGDTNDIIWTASDTNLSPNSTYLWYSLNGGTSYSSLAAAIANSGSYPWEVLTAQSYNAKVRIRVSDSFGNISQESSATPFSITYVPPAEPQNLQINTSNAIDAVLSWQPVTHTVYNTPITPDGYIVLYNETPYEDTQYYYFLGRSFTTDYTHHDVAEFRTQMFYRVVAYKNYRDENFQRVEQLAKARPLLWKDALKALAGGE